MEINSDKPVKKWYKKKRWWLSAIAVLASVIWAVFFRGTEGPTYEYLTVVRGELIQEVSVTGKIQPAQSVDLQFESSGRISSLNYEAGDKVNVGAKIASLENQDLQAKVLAAEADVISAKAELEKTIKDFNSLADQSVSSSLRVELENAKINLEQVIKKSDADLAADYTTAFNTIREVMTQIESSSSVLQYIRKTYKEPFDSNTSQYQIDVSLRIDNINSIFPELDQSGTVITPALYGKVDLVLQELLGACQSLRAAFTYLQNQVQVNPDIVSSTDRASITSTAAAISSDLSSVSSAIQAIVDQKVANEKNIADANAKLSTAKAAFPTEEDILQKTAAVKEAEANLLSARSQLRKTLIVAPFTGIISKIGVERGQTVSSTTAIVSLISASNYQIEANITEIDVAKISVGDEATLTLDAYGSSRVFNAMVSQIDTGATIVEGVTTYKTTLDFKDGELADIRPDMTANIDIQTEKKENVIAIPQRAVINRNGNKIVRVSINNIIEERVVTTGLSGRDGLIEITSGLNEGDIIVTFVNE